MGLSSDVAAKTLRLTSIVRARTARTVARAESRSRTEPHDHRSGHRWYARSAESHRQRPLRAAHGETRQGPSSARRPAPVGWPRCDRRGSPRARTRPQRGRGQSGNRPVLGDSGAGRRVHVRGGRGGRGCVPRSRGPRRARCSRLSSGSSPPAPHWPSPSRSGASATATVSGWRCPRAACPRP